MQQINIKRIIIGSILMFILVHVGFYATYIRHFPEFHGFNMVHHIHGALMGAWVMVLVVQPILIHNKKYDIHRFIGKTTYFLVPLLILYMLLIARENYHSGILVSAHEEVIAKQSNTWMQIFLFIAFYTLAIIFRKQPLLHARFIIGTAIVMIGPPLGRIILTCLNETSVPYFVIIPLVFKTMVAALLLIIDIKNKRNWMPYTIILIAFILADIVYLARNSDFWQAFGQLVTYTLYK